MTLATLKTKANAKLTEFWDLLLPKQEAYFLKHGKFFQLLVTDPVVDGVDTTFVVRKPNDEKHAVDIGFEFNSPIPFQISVDEWGLHNRRGFSVTCTVELPTGEKYIRRREAEPVVQEATYAPQEDLDVPQVELTPKTVTDWTLNTTNWELVVEETL
jgi:hypothetical protein